MDARQTRWDRRKARPAAWAAVAVLLLSALPVVAGAAERVALVIGNSAYEHAPDLPNPPKDAADVGAALARLGFAVTSVDDAGYNDLRLGLLEFEEAAVRSEIAVVFYAGHGIEVGGDNFLVPIEARLATDRAVNREAIPLDWVMGSVKGASTLGLVILDACRNNPFLATMKSTDLTRSVSRGLARVEPAGASMLVAYSAKEGTTASDGEPGANSPYTEALLRYLEEPGLEVGMLFRRVRDAVHAASRKEQLPHVYGSLSGKEVYLASAAAPPPKDTAASAAGGAVQASPSGDAARAYETAKEVDSVVAYQSVVKHFPGTFEADMARARIAKLEGAKEREAQEEARRRRAAEEESYWKKCEENDEARYCEEYLSRYGDGVHARLAKQRLAELAGPPPGKKFRDCPECPEMVVVPGGKFGRPFAVGVYEVTFGEWDACVSGGGCGGYRPDDWGWDRGRRPVINVSWDDAQAYVRWLSGRTGEAYRLLSKAEWEYVARAGTTTAYWWGDDIGRGRANCDGCGSRWDDRQTAPVGSFEANPFGLHDVHGNVWEWTECCWDGDCSRRVVRGGSWFDTPRDLRSALLDWSSPGIQNIYAGFRVARTLTP